MACSRAEHCQLGLRLLTVFSCAQLSLLASDARSTPLTDEHLEVYVHKLLRGAENTTLLG